MQKKLMNISQIKIFINNLDISDEDKDLINEELDKMEFNEGDDKLFNSSINEEEERFIKMSDLGISSNKSIIHSLVKSNVLSSNLISNIYNIQYINNLDAPTMSLKKIEEIPPFLDDCYIWTYFSENQASKNGNRFTLKSDSNNGISDTIFKEVEAAIKRSFGNELYEKFGRIKFASTPSRENEGKIKKVIDEQEEREGKRIAKKFLDLNEGETISGYAKLKIDTSDLTILEFQEHIERFDRELYNKAYGLFSLDVTRDYAGTICKPFFIRELLCQAFVKEEELFYNAKKTLIECDTEKRKRFIRSEEVKTLMEKLIKEQNLKVIVSDAELKKTSGTNIVKYYYYIEERRIDVKWYNKLVSNYESRGVQDNEGTHLSEHVYNNKKVLMNVFYHPEIIKNGITRCEITINGFNKNENINYLELLEREYERIGNKQIFFSVSFQEHWKTLINAIEKNTVFCNRATGEIQIVWYASSVTEQYGGVGGSVVKSMKNLNKDLKELETYEEKELRQKIALKEWNNGILSIVSNFGFSNMPIYVIDFDVIGEKKERIIRFFKNRLFMKTGPTILTPFIFPNTLYSEEIQRKYTPSFMMPDSEKVKWIWRTENLNSKRNLGTKKIYKDFFKFIEIDNEEFLNKIKLSSLSKRQRNTFEKKLINEKIKEECKIEMQEKIKEEVERSLSNRENEILVKEVAKKEDRAYKIKITIGEDFKKPIEQWRSMRMLRELKIFYLYGFKEGEGFIKLCYFKNEDEKNKNVCFAQGEILEQIKELKKSIFKEVEVEYIKYKKKEPVFYSPYQIIPIDCSDPLNLKIIDIKKLLKEKEEDINFNTIEKIVEEEELNYETLKEFKYETGNVRDVDEFKKYTKFNVLGFSRSSLAKTTAKYHLFIQDEKNKEYFIKGVHLQNEIFNIISTKGDLQTLKTPIVLIVGERKYDRKKKKSYNSVIFVLSEIKKSEPSISKVEEEKEELTWDEEELKMSFETIEYEGAVGGLKREEGAMLEWDEEDFKLSF